MPRALTLALALLPAAAWSTTPVTAIKAGRLLDVEHEKVLENVVIVVENGRVPRDRLHRPRRRDRDRPGPAPRAAGLHRLPHPRAAAGRPDRVEYDEQILKESLPYRALRATRAMRIALEHGFTTLRDIGNEGAGFADVDLKKAVAAGIIVGPRLFVATKALAPTGAYGLGGTSYSWQLDMPKGVEMCDGPTAVAARCGTRSPTARTGSRSTPTAVTTSGPTDRSAACPTSRRGAERHRGPGAPDRPEGSRRTASLPPDTPSPWRQAWIPSSTAQVIDDATVKQMAQKKVFSHPTLTVIGYVDAPRSKTNPIWTDLQGRRRSPSGARWQRACRSRSGPTPGASPGTRSTRRRNSRSTWTGDDALAGDPLGDRRRGRRCSERSRTLGVIAPGAHADLVGMKDDPLKDITATERVSFVMKEGVVVRQP